MIVIRTDTGITKLKSWEEVESRPNYMSNHTPNDAKLLSISGYYKFEGKPISCSLSSCHTAHGKGYLVRLSDGKEINIGHKCGKDLFEVEFETMTKDFRDFANGEEYKAVILQAKGLTRQWMDALDTMLDAPGGAKWANAHLRTLTTRFANTAVMKSLTDMKRNRSPHIMVNRKLTNKWEIEQRQATNPGMTWEEACWVRESSGTINGLPALYLENDLQELFIKQAKRNIEEIDNFDILKMPLSQLRTMSKQANDIPILLERCEQALQIAIQFLRPANLRGLRRVISKPDENEQFINYLKELESK
ncbi:hypothetical protein [Photobacterium chitinilyticum]|uniref:Uncharacterized protein n=1 Tax=Photobacterium chitinilyticum TaxID=2485123 RepID=A0A3S4THP4_9GAMM|nr:hypothetical protein [Photobacterium chitinilyticum]RWX52844.1 hypothetical protein EDI28_24960 [Photobacterium chitinilyticum]